MMDHSGAKPGLLKKTYFLLGLDPEDATFVSTMAKQMAAEQYVLTRIKARMLVNNLNN